MNSYFELERLGRESVAKRHRQADHHRRLRSARHAHEAHEAHAPQGVRPRLARLLRAAAERLDPPRESEPVSA